MCFDGHPEIDVQRLKIAPHPAGGGTVNSPTMGDKRGQACPATHAATGRRAAPDRGRPTGEAWPTAALALSWRHGETRAAKTSTA